MKTMSEKAWNKLSIYEKRVLLAKDTLKWLQANRIKPTNGTFCGISFKNEAKNAKKVFESRKSPCAVCAKGAMLYAKTMRTNCINLGEFHNNYKEEESFISDCFSSHEWEILESHFEGFQHLIENKMGIGPIYYFYILCDECKLNTIAEATLLFICLHLIHSDGAFELPVLKEEQERFHTQVVVPFLKKNKWAAKMLKEIKTP